MPGFKFVGFWVAIILVGIAQVEIVSARQGAAEKPAAGLSQAKEPAAIAGFRSAHFGMTQAETVKAIRNDFDIADSNVKRENNAEERTASLVVDVPNLLPDVGLGRAVYIFGYKSKKLIQVNVIWGIPVTAKPDAQALVSTANILRNHFAKKEYTKDSLAMNQSLNDGTVLVFRGADQQGRMVLLLLNNPPKPESKEGEPDETPKLSLRLSYIKNPTAPDVFHIKENDF